MIRSQNLELHKDVLQDCDNFCINFTLSRCNDGIRHTNYAVNVLVDFLNFLFLDYQVDYEDGCITIEEVRVID